MTVKLVPSADSANAPKNATNTALAAALRVKSSLGVLYGIHGYSTTAQFLQVFGTEANPSNGAVPLLSIPIGAGTIINIDFGVYGLFCRGGIYIANSTTGPTRTAGAANTFITARYA